MGFPEYEKEDYGQTLGTFGIGPGCYLVLPVIGPSTVRDTAGSFINIMGGDPWYNASMNGNNEYLSESTYLASRVLSGIDFRAKNIESFESLENNSIDLYASMKSLYLQAAILLLVTTIALAFPSILSADLFLKMLTMRLHFSLIIPVS